MKKVLLIALFFGTASISSAQTGPRRPEECKLTLSQAPMIRGIRLGTNVDQTLALFPGAADVRALRAKLSQIRLGFQSVILSPGQYGSKEKFEGVKSIFLGFLDGQLNFFSLNYDGPEWRTSEQFASKVAEALNLLQVESWKQAQVGMDLSSDGFAVRVERGGGEHGPSIEIKNIQTDIDQTMRERAEEPKEKARRAFKP
jgi:hypothetical protein